MIDGRGHSNSTGALSSLVHPSPRYCKENQGSFGPITSHSPYIELSARASMCRLGRVVEQGAQRTPLPQHNLLRLCTDRLFGRDTPLSLDADTHRGCARKPGANEASSETKARNRSAAEYRSVRETETEKGPWKTQVLSILRACYRLHASISLSMSPPSGKAWLVLLPMPRAYT